MKRLREQGYSLVTSPQNCIEFWNSATRPLYKNGLGLSLSEATSQLKLIERVFAVLPDAPNTYDEWKTLVTTFGVSGTKVHDARLAAVMQTHGINHISTFNFRDFTRYAPLGIVAFDPNTL